MGKQGRGRHGRRSPVWQEEIADAFLAVLRETGNAQAAIRAVGHGDMFYRRRREDPAFARRWAEAVAAADLDLRSKKDVARSPAPAERDAPSTGRQPQSHCLPEPASKPKPSRPGPVIRRNRAGRLQLAAPRDGDWSGESQARFLADLRRTGNFVASARAVGFHFTTVYDHLRHDPAFAREVDEALNEIDLKLEYELIACAGLLLRRPGEARPQGEEEMPFDPIAAMKILAFIDARKGRRVGRGRRRGLPDRPFEEAVASILSKVEAIERHRKLMKAKGDGEDGDGPAPPPAEGGKA
ncbi:MAG TPA: hypothetical protein VF535_14105 [Allosphingosinicella sp.]|jgi:hypothetical protein